MIPQGGQEGPAVSGWEIEMSNEVVRRGLIEKRGG